MPLSGVDCSRNEGVDDTIEDFYAALTPAVAAVFYAGAHAPATGNVQADIDNVDNKIDATPGADAAVQAGYGGRKIP